MGEFTAKRGTWELVGGAPRTNIAGRTREYGVTFSPSTSRSRLHFTDSGTRYEVHLTRSGRVQIRKEDTSNWSDLMPGNDAVSQEALPIGITHQRRRLGEAMTSLPRFDMIAVGRGRILARAADTDQFFHLKLDELFRTSVLRSENGQDIRVRGQDPPVPSTYLKLDPEFYSPGNRASGSPIELRRDYGRHPASLRFGLFNWMMTLGSDALDLTVVAMKPRVWYELDSRPPLKVFDFDDLLKIRIDHLREAFAQQPHLLHDVVLTALKQSFLGTFPDVLSKWIIESIPDKIEEALRQTMNRSLPRVVRDAANQALRALGQAADMVGLLVEPLRQAVISIITDFILSNILEHIASLITAWIQTPLMRDRKVDNLILAAAFGLGLQIQTLASSSDPRGYPRQQALQWDEDPLKIRIRPEMAMQVMREGENPALNRLIEYVVALNRRDRGARIPNQPPSGLPRYTQVSYKLVSSKELQIPRESIDFHEVMDLGVGYSHWHEHWHLGYGGEMHSLLATRPLAQQEGLNSILYRFLNGPIMDGDGYNDGTTNFYILVKLGPKPPYPVIPDDVAHVLENHMDALGSIRHPNSDLHIPGHFRQRYAILWIDEQTYFSQRWKLVHPFKDVMGDLFSQARVLSEHPEYFHFDPDHYWDPFEADCITDTSRMVVARQTLAVTGRDSDTNRTELYTFTFNYGVSDNSWRWRPLPPVPVRLLEDNQATSPNPKMPMVTDESVFANTLGLREDLTLHFRGFKRTLNGALIKGRWFQRVLPATLQPAPHSIYLKGGKPNIGYSHEWDFVSEDAWQAADRYLVMGAYVPRVSARCQYYSVEILADSNGQIPAAADISGEIWRNEPRASSAPLAHNTINFSWDLTTDGTNAVKLGQLKTDRDNLASMSMYENVTRFRLLERGQRGWIAVYFDPRDDDLQPASHLPQIATLSRDDFVAANDPFIQSGTDAAIPSLKTAPIGINLLVKSHARVLRPPIVRKTRVERLQQNGITEAIRFSFWTPLTDDETTENLWSFTLAGLKMDGTQLVLFSTPCFGPFRRAKKPTQALSFIASDSEMLAEERRFDYIWSDLNSGIREQIDSLCTDQGHINRGTSVWFEDIVGHLATPQSLEFATSST